MADTDHSITVLVVGGNYSALPKLRFPLLALAAMQEAGVQLGQACWDVRQSISGISVSLFCPTQAAQRQAQHSSTQKLSKSK